jgi:PAS domain S-box-containing protein
MSNLHKVFTNAITKEKFVQAKPMTINKIYDGKAMITETDPNGIITYANRNFLEFNGFERKELIGLPHSVLRHPDMPKAIFYLMWESIKNGKNIMAVVKNLAKNGDHYWVTTDFDIQRSREGNIRNFIAFRQATPKNVVKTIEPLYATMLEIEEKHGMEESIQYLEAFLEEKQMSYNQFIEELAKPKGISAILFSKMKNFFS